MSEHSKTLWWHTAGERPLPVPLRASTRAEVAIVGAGFTGLTAGLHLARRGIDVIVLEAVAVGAGASGFNAGFVVPNFSRADPARVIEKLGVERGERLLRLVAKGGDRVFETFGELASPGDAEQVGWLQPAANEATATVLRERAATWRRLGRSVAYLDAEETAAQTPVPGYRGALFDPSGGMINPLAYADALARGLLAAGGRIAAPAFVTRCTPGSPRWRLETTSGTVDAETVILATNAFSGGAAARLGATIVPLWVYQIATRPLDAPTARRIAPARVPVSDTRRNLFTYRLDRDNRLISGGMAIAPIGAHARMGRRIAGRLAVELRLEEVPEVEFVWRGPAAMTADGLPHVYEFAPGLFGGIGCNGRGIATTAMLGEELALAAGGVPLQDLAIPKASGRPIRLRTLAPLAPSFALLRAHWQDWRTPKEL